MGHDRKGTIGLTGVTGDFSPIAGTGSGSCKLAVEPSYCGPVNLSELCYILYALYATPKRVVIPDYDQRGADGRLRETTAEKRNLELNEQMTENDK